MPIRNPFARRPGITVTQDENVRPGSSAGSNVDPAHPGFERIDTVGSKASPALSIRSRRSQDIGEYKMSVVNDSGVYLPPSPVERESVWPRKYLSRASSDTKSSSGEIEHFSISRESFDSYRRSFDISARSPVSITDPGARQSLDSARFPRMPRASLSDRPRHFERAPPTPEESETFEEVGLNDDKDSISNTTQHPHQPAKKRGFFSKFGSDAAIPDASLPVDSTRTSSPPTTTMSRFLPQFSGRKRGQSGQGAELGAIPFPVDRPATATSVMKEQEVES